MLMFLMLSMFSFGSAYQANVTVIDDIGSFGGAILKLKSADSSIFSEDKLYPSDYSLVKVGIIKFNLEISLSKVDLKIRLIKDGRVIDEFEAGPFVINGSDILIDRREKVEIVEEVIVEVENVSEVSENVSDDPVVSNESVVITESENLEDKRSFGLLTGMAMFYNEDGSLNLKYSFGGGSVFLLLTVLILTMVLHRRKSTEVTISEDEKELKYMEKKVKEAGEKITKIKDGKAQKNKIENAKAKLAEEEAELRELEGEGSEKSIEKQEKIVDKAEENVEKIEDRD